MTYTQFESARKKYRDQLTTFYAIFGAILASLLIFSFIGGGIFGAIFLFGFVIFPLMMIPLALFHILSNKTRNAYKKAYKSYFVDAALKQVFTNYTYRHDAGLPSALASADGMFNTGDRYASNDYITGHYHETSFAQADIHVQKRRRDRNNQTYYTTLFKGRFLIFEFKKSLNLRLLVVGNDFHNYHLPTKKFGKIKLESQKFNQTFRVYAEDGFEAFYILDPAFMERVMSLGEMHHGKIFLAFIQNRLYVAINDGKDSLEPPSPLKKLDQEAEIQKVSSDIRLLTDIVDNLKI